MIKYLLLLLLLFSYPSLADYEGGGGDFGGGGAGGSWGDDSSSSSSSSSGSSSCSSDGWEFEYIVMYDDRPSFKSVEQACRYTWSSDFLKKRGYKETRQPNGSRRGKYYRKIKTESDWSSSCHIYVGNINYDYPNNIGGLGVVSFSVNKYYKGKVEICDPEAFPAIPNFPIPPDPNHPDNASGGSGSGGSGGSGGSISYNYNTYNYDWDITTNNTTNNTNHITNNNGLSQEQINALIVAIQNTKTDVDLTQVHNLLTAINNNISNLSFEQVLDIEDEINRVTQAIKDNKYDDTQLQNKIDELVEVISNKEIDLTPVTDKQDETNEKLDIINQTILDKQTDLNPVTDRQDEQTGVLLQIRDLLRVEKQSGGNSLPPVDEVNYFYDPWRAIKGFDIHQNRINAQKQCPSGADYSFDFLGYHYELPVYVFCDALSKLAPAFLFLAYMGGAFIIVRGND